MMLSQEWLTEFRRVYLDEYGEDISEDEARDMAMKLLTLYEAMYYGPNALKKDPETSPEDV